MKYLIPILLLGCAILVAPISGKAVDGKATAVETGRIAWIRDYEKGRQLAEKSDKPILLLFQEIPG